MPNPWPIGGVVIHPGTAGAELVRGNTPDVARNPTDRALRFSRRRTTARSPRFPELRRSTTRSSPCVRVLMRCTSSRSPAASFDRPGSACRAILYGSRIEYVAVWNNAVLLGGRFRGDTAGFSFSAEDFDVWSASASLQFLSAALKDPRPSEGARRAAVGAQLLARAASEHRADLKMLGVASALEAWLLRRVPSGQTLRLARHVAWFGCGRHDDSLCGRDRPVCPYLHLNPAQAKDRTRLKTLRDLSDVNVYWRCSEWQQVMDWYDARSGAAHGDPTAVASDQADQAEFWVAHYLSEPILTWLLDHQIDPVGDLERALDEIEDPAGWDSVIDALDSDDPPMRPPGSQ